ncbi:uncharacterized protein LOC119744806 [Patiria miniata]|uniref:Uncharacterized protein n=1 Tax=Patiria miniata TaxID=46514 RepID=A0A914BLS5_PATMI|nr:uncharacterized protein LOC119744806 [Patiria miniata]
MSRIQMMMRSFEVLAALLALIGIAKACSLTDDWKSQSIEERASVPQWVVYGTVVSDQYPPPDAGTGVNQIYWVVVQPLCWLKRGPEVDFQPNDRTRRAAENTNATDHIVEFENITVAEEAPCVFNDLIRGKKYILLLTQGTFSNFTIDDINTESGAFEEPTEETFEAVHRGIDAGLKGYPEGECLEGVEIPCFTGERDPKVCNGGVTVGAAVWFLISAIVMAVSVY